MHQIYYFTGDWCHESEVVLCSKLNLKSVSHITYEEVAVCMLNIRAIKRLLKPEIANLLLVCCVFLTCFSWFSV